MRQVRITVSCDRCIARSVDTPVDESAGVTMSIDEATAERNLDWCSADFAELLAPLAQLWLSKGVVVADRKLPATPSAAAGQEKWSCPVCGEQVQRRSAVGHVWGKHRKGEERVAPKTCPDCDFADDRAQAMGIHRSATHGWDPLEDALAGVRVEVGASHG